MMSLLFGVIVFIVFSCIAFFVVRKVLSEKVRSDTWLLVASQMMLSLGLFVFFDFLVRKLGSIDPEWKPALSFAAPLLVLFWAMYFGKKIVEYLRRRG
jgi:hypothetical protein